MLGDFYKIVTQYVYLGTIQQNRYFYRTTVFDGGAAVSVGNAWIAQVYPSIQDVQSNLCALLQVTVTNLNDPTDFGEIAVTGAVGNVTNQGMPPYDAWYFKYLRGDRTFRPGRKAIGGIGEDDVANGEATASALTRLNVVETQLGANLTRITGGTDVWQPYLVREIVGVPPLEYTPVTGVQYVSVSTQNTRKFNRGI